MTVSPTRAKLTAFALGGFIAGLGGVLLGAVNLTFGSVGALLPRRGLAPLVAIAVIGGLGSLTGAVDGRAVGRSACPSFWPDNDTVPLFTSSIGLLIILLYIPGGFMQIGYYARDSLLRWVEKRLPDRHDEDRRPRRPRRSRASRRSSPPTLNADGSVLATDAPHRALRRPRRGRRRRLPRRCPARSIGLIGTNGAGQVDAAQRDRRLRAERRARVQLLGTRRQPVARAPARPRRARPHVPGRDALSRAHRARDGAARARGARRRRRSGASLLWLPSIRPERRKHAEAARAHRLPRPRPLRRPLHRRAVDRHAPHRRARVGARGRAARDLPRRADRRRRAARSRGVRPVDQARARRSSTPRSSSSSTTSR